MTNSTNTAADREIVVRRAFDAFGGVNRRFTRAGEVAWRPVVQLDTAKARRAE